MIFTLAFAGCERVPGPDKTSPDAKLAILHDWIPEDPKSLDPPNATDPSSLKVAANLFETLYQYDFTVPQRIVPLIAADLPIISKDRLTITIRLRKDIRFQDDPCFKETQGKGRPVVAKDFVYAFKRIADPALEFPTWAFLDRRLAEFDVFRMRLSAASPKARPNTFARPVRGIRALDDFTLQLRLTEPFPQLLYVLALPFTAPVAEEAIRFYGDENGNIPEHPVGTGAFRLKKWERGRRLELERNRNFHPEFFPGHPSSPIAWEQHSKDEGRLLPFLDGVTLDIFEDPQAAWANFKLGLVDLFQLPHELSAEALGGSKLSPELQKKRIQLARSSAIRMTYISFNTQDPLLGNKLLRQALSRAIDRQKWTEYFNAGTGTPLTSTIPPGLPESPTRSGPKYGFNLQQARALLTRMGHPEGKSLPAIRVDLRGADTESRQLGKFVSDQLTAIGVKTEVTYNTFPAYMEKRKNGKLQIMVDTWELDYPDPQNVLQLLYGPNRFPGPNDSNFNDPRFNRLYERLRTMSPGPARAALIAQMDELVQEESPWVLGYAEEPYVLVRPRVENLTRTSFTPNHYKYLRLAAGSNNDRH